MKIRATRKLLNIARIKTVKDLNPLADKMPGEWYASIVSMGMPGKLAIHFLHYPALVSVMVPEKSLNKAIKELPDHLLTLLKDKVFRNCSRNIKLIHYLRYIRLTVDPCWHICMI